MQATVDGMKLYAQQKWGYPLRSFRVQQPNILTPVDLLSFRVVAYSSFANTHKRTPKDVQVGDSGAVIQGGHLALSTLLPHSSSGAGTVRDSGGVRSPLAGQCVGDDGEGGAVCKCRVSWQPHLGGEDRL